MQRVTLLPGYNFHITAAIANAMVVCEDGQPKKTPPFKNPKRNSLLVSTNVRKECLRPGLPVKAL